MSQWQPLGVLRRQAREISDYTRVVREPAGTRHGFIYWVQYRVGKDRDWQDDPFYKPVTNLDRATTRAIVLQAQVSEELKGWGR